MLKEMVKNNKLTAAAALKKLEKQNKDGLAMLSKTANWFVNKANKAKEEKEKVKAKEV